MKKWVDAFFACSEKYRKKVVLASLEAIRIFKKGEKSKEGEELYAYLTSNKVKLIGVTSFIQYIRATSDNKEHLEVEWKHEFSLPTLLYHVKGTPFLLLANANIDYNQNKLNEIEANRGIKELEDLEGIIG